MTRDRKPKEGQAVSRLYCPRSFSGPSDEFAFALMETHSFATVVTVRDGQPAFSHLPVLVDRARGPHGVLQAHMARANPQWRDFASGAPVTVIFQGPHAYVSPRWYEAQADNVPTWNYAVVHAQGTARTLKDAVAYEAMERLVRRFDPDWPLELADADRDAMMREIVVFEVEMTRLDAKFKLSQNRSATDQENVASWLAKSPWEAERATARLMQELRSRK